MKRIVWLLSSLLAGTYAYADQCTDVFTQGAATFSPSGEISFENGARITGTSGTLDFSNINDNSGGSSCDTQACSISGNSAGNLDLEPFRSTDSDDDRTVGNGGNLILSAGEYSSIQVERRGTVTFESTGGLYIIDQLQLKNGTQANFAPGDYWISDLQMEQRSALTVTENDTVRIFVESAQFKNNVEVNDRGNPRNLVLVSYDDVQLEQRAEVTGFIYALDDIQIKNNATVNGAVSAAQIELGQSATVNFIETDVGEADFSTVCEEPPVQTEPELVAHWTFDVCSLSGDAGEVVDVTGGFNGQSIEGADIEVDGQYCQAGDFSGSGAHINIPHNNAFALEEGTISFWFRAPNLSHSSERRRGGMGLFSKDSTGTDNGGDHLTIWLDSDGGLFVRHQDSSSSFEIDTSSSIVSANTWHHLVYTFGSGGMTLYLDAQQVGSDSHTGGLAGNPEPIILASNAWQTDNNVSPPDQLGDHFRGQMDDVRLYDQAMDLTEVQALSALAEGTCDTCVIEDVLEAYWPIDICSVDGSSGEIVDTINGYNGATVDGAGIEESGRFCQAGDFSGTGAHINVPAQSAFEASKGAISLWFNTSDLSHSNTSRHGGQGLVSRDSTGFDGGGHLTIWLQADGSLNVRHQDTSNSYEITTATSIASANTWHHMVYTWGSDGMLLYLDNVEVGSNSSFTGGLNGNQEPLILAANAWQSDDNEADPDDLGDFFIGQLDDVRFYSNQIDTTTIDELFGQAEGTCIVCDNTDLQAHFEFEQASWSGAGDVLDSSTFLRHGNPIGAVTPAIVDEAVSCQVLDVPASSDPDFEDGNAVDTGIDINTIGNQGTISFWYRSSQDPWGSGTERQLFDASNSANSKHFYLALDDGVLEFGIEDTDDKGLFVRLTDLNYAVGEWVHVAVTWDLPGKTLGMYAYHDGATVSATGTRNDIGSTLADMLSIYIGDNRGSYEVNASNDFSANGQFDDFRIYNIVQDSDDIDADRQDRCVNVDHYDVRAFNSTGLTCEAEAFEVVACANAACSEIYDQNSTITFAGVDPVLIPAGGVGTGAVRQTTAGTFTFQIASAVPGTSGDPALTCNGGTDCDIVFSSSALRWLTSAGEPIADQLAEAPFDDVQIEAVRDDNGECVAGLTGAQTLNLTYSCGGDAESACATALTYGGSALSASDTLAVTFDSNGVAVLSNGDGVSDFQLNDVAELNLDATVQGSEGDFAGGTSVDVYPASLSVKLAGSDFVAGDGYLLEVAALGALGNALPSYQPEALQVSAHRDNDADPMSGSFAYADAGNTASTAAESFVPASTLVFNNGEYDFAQASYSEQGLLTLAFQDTYLGNLVESNRVQVSFRPAYLAVQSNAPTLLNTCSAGSFSYFGQANAFGELPILTLTAFNSDNNATQNYTGSDWDWLLGSFDMAAIDYQNPGFGNDIQRFANGSVTLTSGDNNGTASVELSGIEVRYDRAPDALLAPLSSAMQMTLNESFFTNGGLCYDADFVKGGANTCEGFTISDITGANFRYGRLVLDNSSGPQNEDMRVAVHTEYYDGSQFVTNTDDNCTTLMFGQVNFSLTPFGDGADITASLRDDVSANITLENGRSRVFEGIVVPYAPDPADSTQGLEGQFYLELLEINPGVDQIDWEDFLSFDWNNPNGNDHPLSVIVFGRYRGNDRIINWREVVGD